MRKYILLALALAIGTGSLFAANVDVPDEPELEAAYEAEILHEEAYGDADFYSKLQQENEAHSTVIVYRSKNLNAATIADDSHGLVAFDSLLKENYKMYLEDISPIEDNSMKDEQSAQCYNLCAGVEVMGETDKLCSGILKIAKG